MQNTSSKLFLAGLVVFFISFLIPINALESFTHLRPTGLSSIFICPIIGVVGLIFAIKEKSKLFVVLNLLLVLIFPIAMILGSLLGA